MQHIIDRFISYVTVDTESDSNSTTTQVLQTVGFSQSTC
jgi:di/tripeptidase